MTDSKPPRDKQPDDAGADDADAAAGETHPAYVTDITSMEHQVGEHVMTALNHDATVAVLTTVMLGDDGQQRVVSFPLSSQRLSEIRQLLSRASKRKAKRVRCIGFHCRLQEKDVGVDETDDDAGDAEGEREDAREDASDDEHQ